MLTEANLRSKQKAIVEEILHHNGRLIVSGMGSGKTAATLTALRKLLDRCEINHVLVVAPLKVAEETWPTEIENWQQTNVMSFAVAVGDPETRKTAVDVKAEITIINRENLVWLAKYLGSIRNWHYDCVVIDESSMFKAGKKRTTRAKIKKADGTTKVRKGGRMTRFGVLTTARKKINRIYELTGTPAPNGVHDLWGQVYLIDQGESLERSMTAFEKKYYDKNKYTYEVTPKDGAEETIMSLAKRHMVSFEKEEAVPEPIYIPRYIDLPSKAMKEYREFEKTLFSEPYDVEAITKGVLTNKLLQFSNGHMYREDRSVVNVHDEKLKELDRLVEEAQGENMFIMYGFKFDLEVIMKRYPDAVFMKDEPDAIKLWNQGKINKLIAHPASCAHGLNMQFGGHIQIWFGMTWSLEFWQQANARLARPGQTELVSIYPILARNTYDIAAYESLNEKDATQERITKNVIRYINNY